MSGKVEIEMDSSTPEVTEKEKQEMHEKVAAFEQNVLGQLMKRFANPNPAPVKIVYCMNFYQERIPQVLTCLKRVLPYVDRAVLVYDQTVEIVEDGGPMYQDAHRFLLLWGCKQNKVCLSKVGRLFQQTTQRLPRPC